MNNADFIEMFVNLLCKDSPVDYRPHLNGFAIFPNWYSLDRLEAQLEILSKVAHIRKMKEKSFIWFDVRPKEENL